MIFDVSTKAEKFVLFKQSRVFSFRPDLSGNNIKSTDDLLLQSVSSSII